MKAILARKVINIKWKQNQKRALEVQDVYSPRLATVLQYFSSYSCYFITKQAF
jgi:hypothetical protein